MNRVGDAPARAASRAFWEVAYRKKAGLCNLERPFFALDPPPVACLEQNDVVGRATPSGYGHSIFIASHRLAIDQTGPATQRPDGDRDRGIAPGPIDAASSPQSHSGAIAPRHEAVATVLDFMNPPGLSWRPFGRTWQARRDETAVTRSVGAHMPLCPQSGFG